MPASFMKLVGSGAVAVACTVPFATMIRGTASTPNRLLKLAAKAVSPSLIRWASVRFRDAAAASAPASSADCICVLRSSARP